MSDTIKTVHALFFVLTFSWLLCTDAGAAPKSGQTAPPAEMKTGTPAGGQVAVVNNIEKMSKEQFQALPDTATVEFKGKRTSKAQFLAEARQRSREFLAKNAALLKTSAKSGLGERRARLAQEQRSKLEAGSARIQADLASVRTKAAQFDALSKEVLDIDARYASASTDEKKKLELRLTELDRKLKQIGY